MINYFHYYNLEERLDIDQDILRKLFYHNSRKYHPDFYTLENHDTQEQYLRQATLNNEAYKTLSNDNKRLKHLLEVKGAISESDKEQLSQIFLMEMMDINETIMDAEIGEISKTRFESLQQTVEKLTIEINTEIQRIGNGANLDESSMSRLKDCYYRKIYIERLEDNISKLKMP